MKMDLGFMKDNDPRIRKLNDHTLKGGDYVLYWMQQSQRIEYNHALNRASKWSLKLDLPLIVFFGLTDNYPEGNLRHFSFMLDGLVEVCEKLSNHGIKMVTRNVDPDEGAIELSRNAAVTICDMGYLRHQRMWRSNLSSHSKNPIEMVESDVIVPVEEAYPKEAYSAAVLRPRIKKLLFKYLKVPDEVWPDKESMDIDINSMDLIAPGKILKDLNIDRSVDRVKALKGGEKEAGSKLEYFLQNGIEQYENERNDPSKGIGSDLSPYLHFGQISPLYIALKILNEGKNGTDKFLDELIIRRELSMNFTHYNPNYDDFSCLPEWAKNSLEMHQVDKREHLYSLEELGGSKTHDPYWNSAQKEMVTTGKMQNYMRMYWGKKILEWSERPEEAFKTALYLNNKYCLDGRDPNSFAGVAWCFGKHDRPWKERYIFGKVRYMNDRGLERKFNLEPYVRKYGG